MKSVASRVGTGVLAVLLGACSKTGKSDSSAPGKMQEAIASQNSGAPPALPPSHPSLPGQSEAAPAPKGASAVTWPEPSGWQKLPNTSGMRKATYQLPAAPAGADPGELAVFYFGPQQGGGVEANIERWIGQFSGVDASAVQRSDRSVGGLTQHVVEIAKGTYGGGMGPQAGKKDDYALLATVVETPSGPYFFKATGPATTIAAARIEYFKMLDGMQVGAQ